MFQRISEYVIRFKWAVIAFWLILGLVVFLFAPVLSEVAKGDQASFLPADTNAIKSEKLIQELYPDKGNGSSAILTIERESGINDGDKAYAVNLEQYLNSKAEDYKIKNIVSPFSNKTLESSMFSQDKKAAIIIVNLSVPGFKDVTSEVIRNLRSDIKPANGEVNANTPKLPDGLKLNITGNAALGQETVDDIQDSMALTGKITVILVALVLLLIYRSPVAPFIPLASIGLTFVISTGLIAKLTDFGLKVSTFTETFLIAVLFGAGTDYCLLLTSRYREEIVSGKAPMDALRAALPNTSLAILSSGGTVVVGFLAMIFAKFGLYNTTGPSIAIGVAVAILAILTLTPAIIAVLGERIFWPAHPSRTREKEKDGSKFWNKLSSSVTTKPIRYIVVCLVISIPLMISALGINRSFDELGDLRKGSDAKAGFNVIKNHFDQGEMMPMQVVLKTDKNMWSKESLKIVDDIASNISKVDGVAKVRTATRPLGEKPSLLGFDLPQGSLEKNPQLKQAMGLYIAPAGNGVTLDVILSLSPYTTEALNTVNKIRNAVEFTIKDTSFENSEFYVSGPTAVTDELREITAQDFMKVMFFVLLGIFIVLIILLRSIIAPVYLILTIILSYVTTMGISFLVFQKGLGYEGLTWSVPFFSFCILVALGVDYNIFLMTRVKEEYKPGDVTGGTARALASTGKIITSCGIIMAGTFGALMASPVAQLQQIGFTTVVGLLLDTFIIRCLMVPAIAVKMGELNWWPGRKIRVIAEKEKK